MTMPAINVSLPAKEVPEMLTISTSAIAEVIILARDLDRTMPEFQGFVARLPVEQQAELVAVMWIGRGAFEPQEWEEALGVAIQEASSPTADYLAGSPHLADHLENGLDALNISARDEEDELYRT